MNDIVIGPLSAGSSPIREFLKKKPNEGKVRGLVKRFSEEATLKKPGRPPKEIKPRVLAKRHAAVTEVAFKTTTFPPKKPIEKPAKTSQTQKKARLRAIFRRLKPNPAKAVKSAKALFLSTGFSIGSLVYLIPFSDIVKNTGLTISQIRELHRNGEATPKNVSLAIFRQSAVDTPLARDVLSIAQASVFLARAIGSVAKTLSPIVLTGLKSALISLGSVTGALTLFFGGAQLTHGIKGIIQARKKLKIARAERAAFLVKTDIPPVERLLKELHLGRAEKEAHRDMTKAILRTCMGTFITAGGILGLAGMATGSTAAIGITVAALVLGGIAAGIDVANTIYQARSDKERQERYNKAVFEIEIAARSEETWPRLARELGFDEKIALSDRMKAITGYCFGEKAQSLKHESLSRPSARA